MRHSVRQSCRLANILVTKYDTYKHLRTAVWILLAVNTARVGADVECICHGGSNEYTNMLRELRLSLYISHSERSAFNTAALSVKTYSASLLRGEWKCEGAVLRFKMDVLSRFKDVLPCFYLCTYRVWTDTDVRSDMSKFMAISGKDVPESSRDVTWAIQILLPTSPVLQNNTANCLTGHSMSLTLFNCTDITCSKNLW